MTAAAVSAAARSGDAAPAGAFRPEAAPAIAALRAVLVPD